MRTSGWLARGLVRHWLFALNSLTGLLAGLAILAPVLAAIGLAPMADSLYGLYSYMCHQLPERSFFVFGHKMAQCQRDTAIYVALCGAGIVFSFVRDRARPIDWRLFALATAPIALDGGTQLFGLRESNWLLRSTTGGLFGVAALWFVYPYVERQTRRLAELETAPPHRVILYGKRDCTLCDKAKAVLEALRDDYDLSIEEVDIASDPAIAERYATLIPVVHVDGRIVAAGKVSELRLRRALDQMY
jgi:uncharacterized membrane protein